MRTRTLVVLTSIVAALGAFIVLHERDLPGTDERRTLEKRVFRVEADDLDALEIEWGGSIVRLERPPAAEALVGEDPPARAWRLLAPFAGGADGQLVDQLARALATLEFERRLDGASRADVGLEPARGRVIWQSGQGQGTLEIGGEIPASSSVVVASSESAEPLVVGNSVVSAIDRAAGDWRAKEVVSASRDEIERIRLVPSDGEELVLARSGDSFAVDRPFIDAADPDRLEPLLSDLASLRAERFLDPPFAPEVESGLAALVGRYELSIRGESEPLVVEIGAEATADGPRYLRVGGQALEARTHLAEALARLPAEWRSRHWASFDSWRVERIRVEEPAATLVLVRDAGEWRRDGDEISYTTVGDLLYALNSARAETVLSGAEAAAVPVASPALTVILADGEGVEETLTLYGAYGDGFAARVSGRDVVLVLDQARVAEVRAMLVAAREAKPITAEGAEPGAETVSGIAADSADSEAIDAIEEIGEGEEVDSDG